MTSIATSAEAGLPASPATTRHFSQYLAAADLAPQHWTKSSTNTEPTPHQISPYIGKLKSTIAKDILCEVSREKDLVVDPFAGAGTIPLEAAYLGRRVFAADVSPYSRVLTSAKLSLPNSLEEALRIADQALEESSLLGDESSHHVPEWVRRFFHPKTLNECINFSHYCRETGNDFLLSCLLGILHHQRPGFLSFPSSHLVPYLRDKKFPRDKHPELYEYRSLRPRLIAKIERVYKRNVALPTPCEWTFAEQEIEELLWPGEFDCLVTSPPYMNALDYNRDNRLRMWFIDPIPHTLPDHAATRSVDAFENAIKALASAVELRLTSRGWCVLIVGESVSRGPKVHPAQRILETLSKHAPSLKLEKVVRDSIPDIRRSRRSCRATKTELLLYLRKFQ